MTKHTKLQEMIGEALDRHPDSSDVTNVIEATAAWFECVLEQMGLEPAAIPALLRWQYFHSEYMDSLHPNEET
jgi:hypothetical protein